MTKMSKKKITVFAIIGAVILTFVIACAIYLNQCYEALPQVNASLFSTEVVTVSENNNYIIFKPTGKIEAGIIFYPGGQVDPEAYAPLLKKLASSGYYCVLTKMPCNLAIFDKDAADKIRNDTELDIDRWYLAGHSLGGWAAGSYIADHCSEYEGLILLAGYVTDDISNSNLKVLSLYGENDGVMNRERYATSKNNLPIDTTVTVIPGGNHAYFGCYGEQKGDGEALISNEEQIVTTVSLIDEFIKK